MHFPRSIRWRLQLWYGALLVAVLCGFGFTAYYLESARQFRRVDEGLQQRLSVVVDSLRAGPDRGGDRQRVPAPRFTPSQAALFDAPSGYYYVIWMRQADRPISASRNAPADIPKPGSKDAVVRMRGHLRESFLFAAPVDCLLVGRSTATEQADLHAFGGLLAAVGWIVLCVGLLGGWWLASRAIRPVADISAAATEIAAGNLSERISTADTDSELGQLATVLNSTFARLEAAFAQQARFTADAAHELRTPVTVMLTQIQSALTRERTAAEYCETLEACQRATQRMRRLIESLLELARLDAGQEPLHRTDCDLAKVVSDTIALVRPLADARRIQIRADLAPVTAAADADRLAQVAMNLLSNAVTYNRDGGEIIVTTRNGSGTARLMVTNTGSGIAEKDLPHIFERFHRADTSRSGAGHAGLGLAISKAIVDAHGGSISATTVPGSSATFTVALPA